MRPCLLKGMEVPGWSEAVAGRPVAGPRPGRGRAGRNRQARPEEAQEPSWGTAQAAL